MSFYINPYTLYLRDKNISKETLIPPGINNVFGHISPSKSIINPNKIQIQQNSISGIIQKQNSISGINWYTASGTKFNNYGNSVAYGNGIWVAVGINYPIGNSTIIYSNDGINWSAASGTLFTQYGISVSYSGGKWLALGKGENNILYSNDGINWSAASGTLFTGFGINVSYGGGVWIAMGSGTYTILRSTDGITWSVPTFSGGASQFSFYGRYAAYDGISRWISVGDNNGGGNTILTSNDGLGNNWTPVSGTQFSSSGVIVQYGGGYWIAGGIGTNKILYSTNGTTWSESTGTLFDNQCISLEYDGISRWIATGTSSNTILTSINGGVSWSEVSGTTFNTSGGYGNKVLYANGRWIAVGSDNGGTNTILTSTDGVNWSPVTGSKFSIVGYSITYVNRKFIAIGDDNGGTNSIVYSI